MVCSLGSAHWGLPNYSHRFYTLAASTTRVEAMLMAPVHCLVIFKPQLHDHVPWRLAQKGVALNCMSPDRVHTPPDTPQLDVGDPVPRSADQHSSHLLPKECCFSISRLLHWRRYEQPSQGAVWPKTKSHQIDNEHRTWLHSESCRYLARTAIRQTTDEIVLQWSCH